MNANYYYPGAFNPSMGINTQRQIEELQRELGRLSQMQASMYPQSQYKNNVGNKQYETGTYVYVSDYQEVLDYPTPTDGSAVLFLCLDKGLAWSKKFVNGKSSVQALTIGFLNSYDQNETQGTNSSTIKDNQIGNEDIMTLLGALADRLTALENKLGD